MFPLATPLLLAGGGKNAEVVAATALGGTSGTLPAHQAGDLIVIQAWRSGTSGTVPTVPSGWTIVTQGTDAVTGTFSTISLAYRFATASGTPSGTWTNAQQLRVIILRNVKAMSASNTFRNTSTSKGNIFANVAVSGRSFVLGSCTNPIETVPSDLVVPSGATVFAITKNAVSSFADHNFTQTTALGRFTASMALKV